MKLKERKETATNTLELSFDKPNGFEHKKGQYSILRLMEPKVMELDLPYRWLPIASSSEETDLKFKVTLENNSFSKSCELLEIGEEALIFGPVG